MGSKEVSPGGERHSSGPVCDPHRLPFPPRAPWEDTPGCDAGVWVGVGVC